MPDLTAIEWAAQTFAAIVGAFAFGGLLGWLLATHQCTECRRKRHEVR